MRNGKKCVFISYRREGGSELAGRISDRLKAKHCNVFLDVESMEAGCFTEQIDRAIDRSNAVLVIMSPNAFADKGAKKDYYRREIRYAKQKEKLIIPVLMDGFEYPKALEQDLTFLQEEESVTMSIEYFDGVIERIIRLLKRRKK